MAWTIKYTASSKTQLRKLDRQIAKRIVNFMDTRVATLDDPRSIGKALAGSLGSFWRYRVGDYRVICDIQDTTLCVLVVRVANRKNVYRSS